jgi:predicted RNA binding protein YcfA (HicA-like mRNA interferase family)
MSQWPATKAGRVLAALLRIGWNIKRESGGSHKVLEREGWMNYVWAFHDGVEIGPVMFSRIAKKTGLTPEDL